MNKFIGLEVQVYEDILLSKLNIFGVNPIDWCCYNKRFYKIFVPFLGSELLVRSTLVFLRRSLFFIREISEDRNRVIFIVNNPFFKKFKISSYFFKFSFNFFKVFFINKWIPGYLKNRLYLLISRHKVRNSYKNVYNFVKWNKILNRILSLIITIRSPSVRIFLSSSGVNFWGIKESKNLLIPSCGICSANSNSWGIVFPFFLGGSDFNNIELYLKFIKQSFVRGSLKLILNEVGSLMSNIKGIKFFNEKYLKFFNFLSNNIFLFFRDEGSNLSSLSISNYIFSLINFIYRSFNFKLVKVKGVINLWGNLFNNDIFYKYNLCWYLRRQFFIGIVNANLFFILHFFNVFALVLNLLSFLNLNYNDFLFSFCKNGFLFPLLFVFPQELVYYFLYKGYSLFFFWIFLKNFVNILVYWINKFYNFIFFGNYFFNSLSFLLKKDFSYNFFKHVSIFIIFFVLKLFGLKNHKFSFFFILFDQGILEILNKDVFLYNIVYYLNLSSDFSNYFFNFLPFKGDVKIFDNSFFYLKMFFYFKNYLSFFNLQKNFIYNLKNNKKINVFNFILNRIDINLLCHKKSYLGIFKKLFFGNNFLNKYNYFKDYIRNKKYKFYLKKYNFLFYLVNKLFVFKKKKLKKKFKGLINFKLLKFSFKKRNYLSKNYKNFTSIIFKKIKKFLTSNSYNILRFKLSIYRWCLKNFKYNYFSFLSIGNNYKKVEYFHYRLNKFLNFKNIFKILLFTNFNTSFFSINNFIEKKSYSNTILNNFSKFSGLLNNFYLFNLNNFNTKNYVESKSENSKKPLYFFIRYFNNIFVNKQKKDLKNFFVFNLMNNHLVQNKKIENFIKERFIIFFKISFFFSYLNDGFDFLFIAFLKNFSIKQKVNLSLWFNYQFYLKFFDNKLQEKSFFKVRILNVYNLKCDFDFIRANLYFIYVRIFFFKLFSKLNLFFNLGINSSVYFLSSNSFLIYPFTRKFLNFNLKWYFTKPFKNFFIFFNKKNYLNFLIEYRVDFKQKIVSLFSIKNLFYCIRWRLLRFRGSRVDSFFTGFKVCKKKKQKFFSKAKQLTFLNARNISKGMVNLKAKLYYFEKLLILKKLKKKYFFKNIKKKIWTKKKIELKTIFTYFTNQTMLVKKFINRKIKKKFSKKYYFKLKKKLKFFSIKLWQLRRFNFLIKKTIRLFNLYFFKSIKNNSNLKVIILKKLLYKKLNNIKFKFSFFCINHLLIKNIILFGNFFINYFGRVNSKKIKFLHFLKNKRISRFYFIINFNNKKLNFLSIFFVLFNFIFFLLRDCLLYGIFSSIRLIYRLKFIVFSFVFDFVKKLKISLVFIIFFYKFLKIWDYIYLFLKRRKKLKFNLNLKADKKYNGSTIFFIKKVGKIDSFIKKKNKIKIKFIYDYKYYFFFNKLECFNQFYPFKLIKVRRYYFI